MSEELQPFRALPAQPSMPVGFPAPRGKKVSNFTVEQQREIGEIIELWWRAKLASIDSGRVEELADKLDYLCATQGLQLPSAHDIALWKAKRGR